MRTWKEKQFWKTNLYAGNSQTWKKNENENYDRNCVIIRSLPILTDCKVSSEGARFLAFKITIKKLVFRTQTAPHNKMDISLLVNFHIEKTVFLVTSPPQRTAVPSFDACLYLSQRIDTFYTPRHYGHKQPCLC